MFRASAAQLASPELMGQPKAKLNLSALRKSVLFAVTAATLLQLAISYDTNNLIASTIVLCGAFAGIRYSLNRNLLLRYPISTLSILGYTFYYFVIPPIGKFFDFQSINHNLHHPILVWVYVLSGLAIVIVAHAVYRSFQPLWVIRRSLANRFYRPLYFFEMPTNLQLWLLGAIGVVANLIVVRIAHAGQTSIVSALVQPLGPLIYTPYFMAFPNLLDPRYQSGRRRLRFSLIVYSGVLVVVAVIVNSRSFLLVGFASLGALYGYRVMTGTVSPPRLTLRAFITFMFCLWLITGPLANLAASMLIARGSRVDSSPIGLVKTTWKAYQSGTAVRVYEAISRPRLRAQYSEAYYNNIFLNRFGNVRFTDLSIDAAQGVMALGDAPYFRKSELDRVFVILPTPLIRALHLGIDKSTYAASSEDILYYIATLKPAGGFLTGSPLVIMRMTLGLMWPLYFGVLAAIVFSVLDASSDLLWVSDTKGNHVFDCVIFNPMVAGTLFMTACFFTSFGAQNLTEYIDFITRHWIQTGLLYAGAFLLAGAASSLLLGWAWRKPDAGGHAVSNAGRF